MAKGFLEDMVKVKRARRAEDNVLVQDSRLEKKSPRKTKRYRPWLVAGVSILFFFFALSYLFSNAVVTVDLRSQALDLARNFSVSKDTSNTAGLSFETVTLSGEETKIIQSTEKVESKEQAKGLVVIYNNFSSATQRLDINTRLLGDNGKIYKTENAVTVPGMQGSTPGSVEVYVYASEPGEEYNAEPMDFQVVGFQGTPKYEKFYARSKGPISGGFSGLTPALSSEQKLNLAKEMQMRLKDKLFQQAKSETPSEFLLLEDATSVVLDGMSFDFDTSGGDMVTARVKGTLFGVLFEKEALAHKIAQLEIKGFDGEKVFVPEIESLEFALVDMDASSFRDAKNINFKLSGGVKVVWSLDEDTLAFDLLNKKKSEFNNILLRYKSIASAKLTMRPFWKRSFPEDLEDIKIVVNY